MGLLQDFLRKLRENNQPESLEDLYDERTKDRELLLLRREINKLNDEEEKRQLKQELAVRMRQRTSDNYFGFKDNRKEGIIKALKNKNPNPSYLKKYPMKGRL